MGIGRATSFALVLAALGACQGDGADSAAELAAQIRALDAEGALALANEWRMTKPTVGSTLTADAVTFVLPGGSQVSVPLPEDMMVLAVAPYVTSTHECQIHCCRNNALDQSRTLSEGAWRFARRILLGGDAAVVAVHPATGQADAAVARAGAMGN